MIPQAQPSQPSRLVLSVESFVRKNERYACVRGKPYPRIITTTKYKQWLLVVAEEVRRLGAPQIRSGRWRLTVITVWPTARHLDSKFPMGDSDASLSAMKDALQEAGVLDDDVRVLEDATFNLYVKGERRIVALLEQIDRDPARPTDLYTALQSEVEASRASVSYRQKTAEHLMKPKRAAKVKARKVAK